MPLSRLPCVTRRGEVLFVCSDADGLPSAQRSGRARLWRRGPRADMAPGRETHHYEKISSHKREGRRAQARAASTQIKI